MFESMHVCVCVLARVCVNVSVCGECVCDLVYMQVQFLKVTRFSPPLIGNW